MTHGLYVAEVARTYRLTPGMVRVTFTGADVRNFPSTGVGDEYVRVHFPHSGQELVLPTLAEDGNWDYSSCDEQHIEPYTIRRFDSQAGEIDIDFVVHGHGRAGTWAANARMGEKVAFGEPRALYEPPQNARTQVFVCDATGIPALARLVEQLPSEVRAVAAIEVAKPDHRLDLGLGKVQVTWIVGRGNGVAPSAITEALRALPLDDECYVWVAGEAGELRHARRYLRHERKLSAEHYKVIGYWRDKQEEWLERYDALSPDTVEALQAIWNADDDEEVLRDRYDDRMAQLGL